MRTLSFVFALALASVGALFSGLLIARATDPDPELDAPFVLPPAPPGSSWTPLLSATVPVTAAKSYGTGWVASCREAVSGKPELGYLVRIVTCWHVVDEPEDLRVWRSGRPNSCCVAWSDRETDVAILMVAVPEPWPVLDLGTEPAFGDPLRSVGFPHAGPGCPWAFSGHACSPDRSSMTSGPGASGAAVVDANGRVVGMVRGWVGDTGDGLMWLVPLSVLRSAIESQR